MKAIQITLDDDLHRRAKTLAYQTGVTLTELVRRAIKDNVELLEEAKTYRVPERRPQ
jgi:predicted transcriptional regulator